MNQNISQKNEEWCKNKFCDYDKLPESEKEFDRDIARILQKINIKG